MPSPLTAAAVTVALTAALTAALTVALSLAPATPLPDATEAARAGMTTEAFGIGSRADSLEERADSLYQAGAFPEARRAYELLVRRDSTVARHWYRLAVCQHRERRFTEARSSLERAIAGAREAPGGQMLLSFAAYGAAAAHARLSDSASSEGGTATQRAMAFAWLDSALATGFRSVTQLEGDADFEALRGDPRYAALAERMRRAAQPCAYDLDFRRFDFWLGEWEVRTTTGQLAGTSRIERVSGGCALLENWTDGQGGTGKSLNTYNRRVGSWQQYWVGQMGGVTEYRTSEWNGTSLSLFADGAGADGSPMRIRLTFSPIAPGVVRQHGEQSLDGGATWRTTYDLRYHRKRSP